MAQPPSTAGSGCQLVIFDCDGVLVDSEVVSCTIVASMLSNHGVPCDLPMALDRYLGRSASLVTEDYMRLTGRPVPQGFVDEWRARLFEAFLGELAPIDGVAEAIKALSIPYCLASSSDEQRIELSLRKTGLWSLFDGRIFSSTMVANGKPAPDLFLLAAERMRILPQHCVVVEDSVSGVMAAKAAGMTAIGFTAGSHFAVRDRTTDLLNAGADCIVAGMNGLQIQIAR
jgi:HAD superfamily hydrolase (TIGR01509 family)